MILLCLPDEDGLKVTVALSLLSGNLRGPSTEGSWNEWLTWKPGGGSITGKELRLQQRRPGHC